MTNIKNKLSQDPELHDLKTAIDNCIGLDKPITHGYLSRVYTFEVITNSFCILDFRLDPVTQSTIFNKDDKHILFVLESPHIFDYTDSEVPTLSILRSYLEAILVKLLDDSDSPIEYDTQYIIRIIDAIPYQASLGTYQKYSKKITYRIFKKIWEEYGYEKKFQKEIEELPEESIVINLCTNSDVLINGEYFNPKRAICYAMNCRGYDIYYTELPHPASMTYEESSFNLEDGIDNFELFVYSKKD